MLRLIDEARDEEERLSFLQIMPENKQTQETLETQQENAKKQLAKLSDVSQKLNEAGQQIEQASMIQEETKKLEEQLVASVSNTLAILEEAE